MSARVTWIGLAEFQQELTALPQSLTDQSQATIRQAATLTASDLRGSYPVKAGRMVAGISTREIQASGPYTFSVQVRSDAPHAHLWEYGTAVRRNARGANRGAVGAHRQRGTHAIADEHGAAMQFTLAEMVRANGFEVYGSFGL